MHALEDNTGAYEYMQQTRFAWSEPDWIGVALGSFRAVSRGLSVRCVHGKTFCKLIVATSYVALL